MKGNHPAVSYGGGLVRELLDGERKEYFLLNGCEVAECFFCIEEMTQSHSIVCPGRKEQRRNLDMTNLDDLVTYFNDILNQ